MQSPEDCDHSNFECPDYWVYTDDEGNYEGETVECVCNLCGHIWYENY